MLENYILTSDGEEYVNVDCVREALGVGNEHADILGAIRKLREDNDLLEELHANHISQLNDYADLAFELGIGSGDAESIKDYIISLKKERDQLKEKCDRMKKQASAMYGTSCGYYGDEQPAFLCNVISYGLELAPIKAHSLMDEPSYPIHNDSIRVELELELTPTANCKGTFDIEDLKHYIQNYGREKKLGAVESVDYKNAKVARAELACLYKQVLGKEKLDTDLSPHEIMKAILDAVKKREDFLRELACSLGFGNPVVRPDNIDQKEKDILERVEKLKDGVWPCENSSTFAEFLRKEFPKFCKRYNVTPLYCTYPRGGSVHDWIQYVFDVLTDYRELANNNFNKADEFRKEKCAVEDSLAELRDAQFASDQCLRSVYMHVHEGTGYGISDVYAAPDKLADGIVTRYNSARMSSRLETLSEIDKHIDELCGKYNVVQPDRKSVTKDRLDYIFGVLAENRELYNSEWKWVEKLKKEKRVVEDSLAELILFKGAVAKAVCSNPNDSNADILKAVEAVMERATELQFNTVDKELVDKLARLRSDICSALCLGGETSDEDVLKRIRNILNLCDDHFSRYREQFGLRQQWHARYESEHERANGVQKALDREREKCRIKDISLETAKKQYEKVCGNLETAECALNGMKSKVRELREEKSKVISALGQDVWDGCLK